MTDALRGKGVNTDKLARARELFEKYMKEHWQENGEGENAERRYSVGEKGVESERGRKYNPFRNVAKGVFGYTGTDRVFSNRAALDTFEKNQRSKDGGFIGHSAATVEGEDEVIFILHGEYGNSYVPRFYSIPSRVISKEFDIIGAIYGYENTVSGRDLRYASRNLKAHGVTLYAWAGDRYSRTSSRQRGVGIGIEGRDGIHTDGSGWSFRTGDSDISGGIYDGVRYSLPGDEALRRTLRSGIETELDNAERARNRDAAAVHERAAQSALGQIRLYEQRNSAKSDTDVMSSIFSSGGGGNLPLLYCHISSDIFRLQGEFSNLLYLLECELLGAVCTSFYSFQHQHAKNACCLPMLVLAVLKCCPSC